jgi:hypothetical protein
LWARTASPRTTSTAPSAAVLASQAPSRSFLLMRSEHRKHHRRRQFVRHQLADSGKPAGLPSPECLLQSLVVDERYAAVLTLWQGHAGKRAQGGPYCARGDAFPCWMSRSAVPLQNAIRGSGAIRNPRRSYTIPSGSRPPDNFRSLDRRRRRDGKLWAEATRAGAFTGGG